MVEHAKFRLGLRDVKFSFFQSEKTDDFWLAAPMKEEINNLITLSSRWTRYWRDYANFPWSNAKFEKFCGRGSRGMMHPLRTKFSE